MGGGWSEAAWWEVSFDRLTTGSSASSGPAFRLRLARARAFAQDDGRDGAAIVSLEAVEGFQEIAPRETGPGTKPRSCVSGCLNPIGWIDRWMCPRSLVCENFHLFDGGQFDRQCKRSCRRRRSSGTSPLSFMHSPDLGSRGSRPDLGRWPVCQYVN